ncbi:hypothetical protein FXO38_16154 [Capsicum annuum]|nr:hypothetical protein FXO38_16154 [Capsicum annuum]KAF3676944.1 hypothetical protein FXO37_05068 [Capsicum annuum]
MMEEKTKNEPENYGETWAKCYTNFTIQVQIQTEEDGLVPSNGERNHALLSHHKFTEIIIFDASYGQFLKANDEQPVTSKRSSFMEEVLREGAYDYEVALVEYLRENPMIRVGLDFFEDEPYIKPSLSDMKNIVVVPHMAFASKSNPNSVDAFLDKNSPPPAASSNIVNSKALGSFIGLSFLAWYMSGKIKAFDQRGHVYKLYLMKKDEMDGMLRGCSSAAQMVVEAEAVIVAA